MQGANGDALVKQKYLNLEVISFTDGKHAVAKAANFLLKKHYLNADAEVPELTESDMADALAEIGVFSFNVVCLLFNYFSVEI